MPTRRYRSASDLGNLGESIVAGWASSVGCVVNQSGDDRAGWDLLLEASPQEASHLADPLGHTDTFPLRARLQVKATDKQTGRVRKVALSTWIRLVEAPEPAFFLVLEMGGHDTPQAAFLVHVDDEAIREVYRRRREAQVSGETGLHKIYRDVRYRDVPSIGPLSGAGLLDAVDHAVDAVGTDYVTWKRTVQTTAGFEDGQAIAEVTIEDGPHPAVQFAELEVGLRTEIPFRDADLYPLRFGLRSEQPALSIPAGTFTAPPPEAVDTAELVLSAPTLGLQARARADLFWSPSAVVAVRDEDSPDTGAPVTGVPLRTHVRAQHVSVVFRAEDQRFDLTFDPPGADDPVPLRGLREMFAVVHTGVAARDSQAPIEVAVHSGRGKTFRSGLGQATVRDLPGEGLATVRALFDALWRIAQAHEVEDHLAVSLQQVVDQGQLISVIDGAGQRTLAGNVEFHTSYGSDEAFAREDPKGLPFSYISGVTFADWHLVSVVQFGRAVVESEGDLKRTLHVPIDVPRILHRHTRRPGDPAPDFFDLGRAAARTVGERILMAEQPHVHVIGPDD